jgi:phosphatidylserine decarboxylase
MIIYIDRKTGQKMEEKVYGQRALKLLYGKDLLSKIFGAPLLHLISRFPLFSHFYGWWQKQPWTKKKIKPFIEEYQVDDSEFAHTEFSSFNDFFIRKLKPQARPLSSSPLIIPADGRYWFYENVDETDHFIVKGQKFSLSALLNVPANEGQSMIIARLCPTDYHRFHFPCDCTPGRTRLINGPLYSVNPIAIKQNIRILTENKRCLTELKTKFGTMQYIEIGATFVGSIHQTFTPNAPYKKGDEKGYFAFGASALILLFEKGSISIDKDLLHATQQGYEMKCLMGQPL